MPSFSLILLISIGTLTSAQIYSYENEDGSYTIGTNSDSTGQTPNSVVALLNKSSGWINNRQFIDNRASRQQGGLLQPHVEILKLAETFLNLKGEIASRAYAVIYDNYDLIRSVYNTILTKATTLHQFTLQGVILLRKLLEILSSLFSQWQIPPLMREDMNNMVYNL